MTLRRVILTILAVVLSTLAPPPPHRHHHRAPPPPPPPPPPPHREADVTSRMYYPTPRPKIGESHAGSIDRPDSRCAHAAAALACLRRPPPATARARGRRSARTSILQTRISESARERTTQCRAFRRRAARRPPAARLPPPSTLHLPTRDVSRHVWGKPRCDTHAWRCHRRALPHGARVFLYATDTTTRRARAARIRVRPRPRSPPALSRARRRAVADSVAVPSRRRCARRPAAHRPRPLLAELTAARMYRLTYGAA